MSIDPTKSGVPRSGILRGWYRLPLLMRAVLSALIVLGVLQSVATSLLLLNLKVAPAIPWSGPLVVVWLWLGLRWFGGSWGPASTSEARREALRARPIDRSVRRTAAIAAILTMMFIVTFTMLTYRIIEIPDEGAPLPVLPWWSLYTDLLLVAVIAGVSEESAFRGYLQAPLETRYGPVAAIAISALLFWAVHLNHPSGLARFPALIAMGGMLGALAWASRSIYPAIAVHVAADALVFIASTAGVGPRSIWNPPLVADSGLDGAFLLTMALAIATGIGTIAMIRSLVSSGVHGEDEARRT